MDQTEGPWSHEESEMLFDRLFYMPEKHETILRDHAFSGNIGPSLSHLMHEDIENHQNSTLKWKSSLMTNDLSNLTIRDPNIFIQPPFVIDINGGQRNSYIHDLTLRLALGGISDQAPSIGDMAMDTGSQNSIHQGNSSHEVGGVVSGQAPSISDMAMETGSQNSIHQGNSSHEVGGVVSGQAPSISDMARGNMSSGGTHSFSHDHSAPSRNALNKRDSSPMMIDNESDSDSVQQFLGSYFGQNNFDSDFGQSYFGW